jgi:hypothetical protein
LNEAFGRSRRGFPPLKPGSEYPAALDEGELFEFFFETIAPIDVRAFAIDTVENPLETFDFEGRVDALSMSIGPPRLWSDVTGLAVHVTLR